MNPGMPQSGMPSGASSGAPYFNGWSPDGGFAQPQQNYGGFGYSSPYGGMSGGFGSPFGGYGGSGFGSPFGSPYGGFGGFGYSSPFGQFQTPNFAAKGGSGQPQLSTSPATPNTPTQAPGSGSLLPGTSNLGNTPVPQLQPAPIPQAVPPQMMNPVSGPAQMLPQQMFNQTRIPGASSVLPGRNMLIGGYR